MTSTTFRERLQPELEMDDLATRAKVAQGYALQAIADGDAERLTQAVARMTLRFEQYDALAPAGWPMRDVYRDRHGLVWAILEALGEDGHDAMFNRLLEVAYQYAAESAGVDREAATTEAALSMRRWRYQPLPAIE